MTLRLLFLSCISTDLLSIVFIIFGSILLAPLNTFLVYLLMYLFSFHQTNHHVVP